ncbi:MAG: M14 family metallopeptidase [Pseudomonas protegens]
MNLASFSASYAEARRKFLNGCELRGLQVESHIHPFKGRDQETLAIDVCRVGPANARNLMVISSGCHGVEGFCGSAVQVDLLGDDHWAQRTASPDLAVLYLHALNPYGFSWMRRVTHENVDLNRNFLDFSQPLPDNPDYRAIHNLLLPRNWPASISSSARLMLFAARRGRSALQSAITRGQHSHPDGLFFSGVEPSWSNLQIRQILRRHARHCLRIGWIDIHTGLGPNGVGERIYKGRASAADLQRAQAWWGPEVTNSFDGSSTSAQLDGTLDLAVMEECPQAQYNGLTLEYGTLPGPQVLNALRAEQWLQRNPLAPRSRFEQIKRQMRDAFYDDRPQWQQQVLQQAREVCELTRKGLLSPDPLQG